jgi:hypothetical protein
MIGQDASRPQHEPLAFGSETFKALPSPDKWNLQLVLKPRMPSDSAGCDT